MPVIPSGAVNPAQIAGYVISYTQITATVNIVGTTEGTATTVISPGAVTFDGKAVFCEFYCISLIPPSAAPGDESHVGLFEAGALVYSVALCQNNVTNAASFNTTLGKFRFTPSAGAHTYTLAAWASSTTNTPRVLCGAGGPGNHPPAYLAFIKG